jgi:hypothetical protein
MGPEIVGRPDDFVDARPGMPGPYIAVGAYFAPKPALVVVRIQFR